MTSIMTLLSKDMRKHTFNMLLAALAVCDLMYTIFNAPIHANTTFEFVSHWFTESTFLFHVYVNILYPMSAASFRAFTYMTLDITVERFIAVCRPHQYRNILQVIRKIILTIKYDLHQLELECGCGVAVAART